MEKAKVYFTREIAPNAQLKMYRGVLGKDLPGRAAVKVHSGEKENQRAANLGDGIREYNLVCSG